MIDMYRIEYEYYDKRGHTRIKKIECGGLDRVKFHCNNILELKEHRPIRTPRITKVNGDIPDTELNFKEIIKQ
jgi:hypothetical protein